MISANNITLRVGKKALFEDVNIKFTEGNCYGLIGANGAGKSTFLKILSGQLEPTKGDIVITPGQRLSFLQQDHFKYDAYTVLDTVIMGNLRLYEIMKEKEAIYAKEDFTDEDGIRASELEGEFAEMNGWEAESDAATLLNGLGIDTEFHYAQMADLTGSMKVKVLLAQALFGNPDILLLDEPTNHLDLPAIEWLEEFLINFDNTVIVVSHDRYFLNKVCTQTADIDYGKIQLYAGNYDFWYESSQLLIKQMKEANKKKEEKIKELQEFISRFSANASKSKQATSRKRALEKIQLDDMRPSSRKYPYIDFRPNREIGNEVLMVENLSKTIDGVKVLDNISFTLGREDKVAFVGANEQAITTFFKIITGEMEPDEGNYKWGITTTQAYFPKDNTQEFDNDLTITDWLTQYSEIKDATYVRGFLGRMLFPGEDGVKRVRVLSGGEKVRCLLSKMMISGANILILDEPTNHLDNEMVTWLEDFLRSFKGVVIMVTHDRYFLDRVTNKILEISHGSLYAYEANYSKFLELKAEREEMELASERKRQSVLRMELEWAKRGCRARSTKQRARLERLEALKNGKAPVRDANVELDSVETRMGKKTIELHHISKSFGEKKILDDFNYIVLRNQRLGIIGPNGCGKSTLIKIIDGMIQPDAGEVEIGETIRIGYFAQEVPDMDTNQRVIDYIRDVAEYIPTRDGKISATMMLERFLFDSAMQYAPIAKLSGGEKRRLYLLKVLMEAPNVLLLDEPSNDLDIPTLTILEDYLDSFAGIVIAVSHDRYFLDNIVDRIFAFEGNGHLTQYEGGYTDYTEALARKGGAVSEGQSTAVGAEKKKSAQADWKQNRPQKLKFTYKEQREFETIDDDIAALEELLEKLDKDMEANATNSVKLREIMEQKEKAQADLDEKMDRWVYLNDLAERIEAQKSEK